MYRRQKQVAKGPIRQSHESLKQNNCRGHLRARHRRRTSSDVRRRPRSDVPANSVSRSTFSTTSPVDWADSRDHNKDPPLSFFNFFFKEFWLASLSETPPAPELPTNLGVSGHGGDAAAFASLWRGAREDTFTTLSLFEAPRLSSRGSLPSTVPTLGRENEKKISRVFAWQAR